MRDEDLDPARRSSSAPPAGRDKFQTHAALIFFFFFFFCSLINNRERSPVRRPGNISMHMWVCRERKQTEQRRVYGFERRRAAAALAASALGSHIFNNLSLEIHKY